MLLRTPQTLKKSGMNKGNAMSYLAFIVRIVHVCVEKQSAVKPHDAIGGKEEEPALIVVSWKNTQQSLPFVYRLPYPRKISFHISRWYQFIFVYFIFENLILHIFLIIIIIIRCSGMFRDVPGCSGMFRDVPCSWFYRRPNESPQGLIKLIWAFIRCHGVCSNMWALLVPFVTNSQFAEY